MLGLITEKNWNEIENEFSGSIHVFFDSLEEKPETFLELVDLFVFHCEEKQEQQRTEGNNNDLS